ncbi:hypothetical protein K505DRAFT_141474 [Melanomma pulvis-pyrius CBS 109.77]|uniref:Uncharacterized protein n=1 Tax=Melanomma pulvis-pyrius CBS 109.77 TaxID=1314802 RepID=A0A6A6WR94_9PLEO|nr:hypothetical protein K505DRAFT_141474 [Melanomma pulvis-pyrius CBS 109.77]
MSMSMPMSMSMGLREGLAVVLGRLGSLGRRGWRGLVLRDDGLVELLLLILILIIGRDTIVCLPTYLDRRPRSSRFIREALCARLGDGLLLDPHCVLCVNRFALFSLAFVDTASCFPRNLTQPRDFAYGLENTRFYSMRVWIPLQYLGAGSMARESLLSIASSCFADGLHGRCMYLRG